ncbi:MAG: aminopeptidase P family protein [Eubacteriales bacterium]|nr:aminopeptidase P family protein [Eubacteriales bacterium]
MTIPERLTALRERMAAHHIDIYYIPTDDYHCSEYVGDYFKCRRWISGFTGSAGVVVVTATAAGLWTDGRYFLQAADQLSGSTIHLYRMGEPGVPTVTEYLAQTLRDGQCLGFDGRTVTASWLDTLKDELGDTTITLKTDVDLVGEIWTDRPPISCKPVWLLEERYTGKSRSSKLCTLQKELKSSGVDWLVLSTLDDIAWLLNIRGDDVAYNPVVLSYLMVSPHAVRLFVHPEALSPAVQDALAHDGIRCEPYDAITDHLSGLTKGTVQLDRRSTNCALVQSLPDHVTILDQPSPTQLAKAAKNKVEIANEREAHRKDGVAMVRFLRWLKENIGHIPITEICAAEKLESFRREQEHYLEPSFDPISAYDAHSAIVHYSATPQSNATLKPEGFLLLDTGGQYLEGTTDITRTVALGPLTDKMRQHYTAVLRGNLNLAAAVFRSGCTGVNLDLLARAPLWELGLDFNHGTGHGVGYLLNCHEGPNSFRWKIAPNPADNAAFQEGMITSDEPGVYLTGQYGIRLENLLVCQKKQRTEFGQFLCFEPLTMVPFDRDAIVPEQMTRRERELLNAYHAQVYRELAPRLDEADRRWLLDATREI